MKFRNKLTSVALATILASTLLVSFVFAQAPGGTNTATINQSDLTHQRDLETILNKTSKADLTYTQKFNDATLNCKNLGDTIFSVTNSAATGTKVTTVWSQADNRCMFAAVLSNKAKGPDFLSQKYNRNFVVETSLNDYMSQQLWNSIFLSKTKTSLSAAEYQEREAKVEASNKQPESVGLLSTIVDWILTPLFNLLATIVLGFAALAGYILNFAITQTTTAAQPEFVSIGWRIVRDFFNMFFILALIVMSIATIIRRPASYDARKLILNLIFMALLVNFSKVIAETLIMGSDSLVRLFAGNWNISWGQYFHNLVEGGQGSIGLVSSGGASAALVGGILKLVAAFLITASFGAIAILLLIRLIGLWVLIMLSPAAYALSILPRTQALAQQWWSTFLKYLFWAPVAVFFLYVGQTLIKYRTSNGMVDALFISIFFFGALWTARAAGMYGSKAVLDYADTFWKGGSQIAGKYVMRGSMAKHMGQGLEKVPGIKPVGTGLKKFGKGWQTAAQHIEATPNTVKQAFEVAENDYQKGVSKAARAQGRIMSRILPFDAESFEKDDVIKWDAEETRRVVRQRIESGKFSGADFADLVPNLNRKATRGLVKLFEESATVKNWTPGHTTKLDEALKKKLSTGEMGGTPLMNILPPGSVGGPGVAPGFVLEPTPEDPYNMRVIYNKKAKGATTPKPYDVKMDGTYNNDLSDFGSLEQEERRETDYKVLTEKFNRTIEAAKALENDPDAENKLRQRAFTSKDIFAPEEINRVRDEIQDHIGVSLRVDLDPKWGSLLSRSGQRLKLSSKVASDERIDMSVDESRYYPKEQIGELVKVLKENGEMSEEGINKMVAAAERAGGVEVVRGVPKTDKRAVEEIVNLQIKSEPAQIRMARQAQGNHEGSHSVLNYIQRSNKELYRNIINKITSFDAQRFNELENEIRNIPAYKNISRDDVVEEIISNKKFASRLDSRLTKELGELLAPAIKGHRELRVKTGREIRSEDRVKALAGKLEKRNQAVPQQAKQFDFEI